MRIDSSGRVGIGTTDIEETLTIAKTDGGDGIVAGFRSDAGFSQFKIVTKNSQLDWGLDVAGGRNIYFTTNTTERMRIDSSGNVSVTTVLTAPNLNVSANNGIYNSGTNTVGIQTNGAARLIVDSSGNVGIGSTDPARKLELRGDRDAIIRLENTRTTESAGQILGAIEFFGNDTSSPGAGVKSSIVARTAGGGEASYLTFSTTSTVNDVEKMRLQSNGDLHVDGDVIAYSTTISDQRLKDDIQTIDNALDKVSNLRGVSYTWNNGKRKGQKDLGLIAQEVEKVLPELVREKEMPMIDGGTYKTVDYEKIVGVLIEAVKELTDKVNKLEAK
jgi:hypothetical protein